MVYRSRKDEFVKKLNRIYIPRYFRKPLFKLFNKTLPKVQVADDVIPKIISDKYKFIFICNPLVASTSFKEALVRNPERDYGARIKEFNLEKYYNYYKEYFIFSFVRNPLSRVVSCYEAVPQFFD